jgi:hypothetical protein
MRVGDVDLAARRVWVREPAVEVEGRRVRNPRPKGGSVRAVMVGPRGASTDTCWPALSRPQPSGWSSFAKRAGSADLGPGPALLAAVASHVRVKVCGVDAGRPTDFHVRQLAVPH